MAQSIVGAGYGKAPLGIIQLGERPMTIAIRKQAYDLTPADFDTVPVCELPRSKRVDEFANMSDEELRQYVYGKELDS